MKRAIFLAYLHTLGALIRALDAISAHLDRAIDRREDWPS